MSQVLLKSKVFLFLPESRTEGFPIILLDAMACGAIIVSKSFEGISDVLVHNKNAFIADTDDDIIERIAGVLRTRFDTRTIIQNAKSYVVTRGSLANVHKYVSAFNV